MRQNEQRRIRNASARTAMRTSIKKVRAALQANDLNAARQALQAAIPIIDQSASSGITHRRTASRHVSRLSSHPHQLQQRTAS